MFEVKNKDTGEIIKVYGVQMVHHKAEEGWTEDWDEAEFIVFEKGEWKAVSGFNLVPLD